MEINTSTCESVIWPESKTTRCSFCGKEAALVTQLITNEMSSCEVKAAAQAKLLPELLSPISCQSASQGVLGSSDSV